MVKLHKYGCEEKYFLSRVLGFNSPKHQMKQLPKPNSFIYPARESSLIPAGFLTAQYLRIV